MATDPKKKSSTKVKESAVTGRKRKYEVTQPDGSKVNVSKSLKTAAKNKTGIMKSRGTYKGKELVDDTGRAFGIKLNDGTVKKSKGNKKVMNKLMDELARDKKMFGKSDTKQKARQERIGKATYKPRTK